MTARDPARGGASDRSEPSKGDPIQRLAPSRSREDRLQAVAETRRAATPKGRAALQRIAKATDEDPLLRAAAIAGLAAQGRAVTVEEHPPAAVNSALRKAAAILARQQVVAAAERGEAVRLPTFTRLRSSGEGVAIVSRKLSAAERVRAAVASSMVAERLGEIVALTCKGWEDNEYAILVYSDLDPAQLLQKPARPAQVAVHHTDEVDIWTAPFEVLTIPAEGGRLQILVIDERGNPRFAGSATIHRTEANFEVGAVSRPGASELTIRGRVVNGRMMIDEARVGTRAVAPRQPRRLKGGTIDGTGRQRRR
jgi:hypothetical protein